MSRRPRYLCTGDLIHEGSHRCADWARSDLAVCDWLLEKQRTKTEVRRILKRPKRKYPKKHGLPSLMEVRWAWRVFRVMWLTKPSDEAFHTVTVDSIEKLHEGEGLAAHEIRSLATIAALAARGVPLCPHCAEMVNAQDWYGPATWDEEMKEHIEAVRDELAETGNDGQDRFEDLLRWP